MEQIVKVDWKELAQAADHWFPLFDSSFAHDNVPLLIVKARMGRTEVRRRAPLPELSLSKILYERNHTKNY